jgi:hypothetical protein
VDFNSLLDAHEHSLTVLNNSVSIAEQRAHNQFVRDYAVRIRMVRSDLGATDAVMSFDQKPDAERPK